MQTNSKQIIDSALIEHVARRVLLGKSVSSIARAVGVSRYRIVRLMQGELFRVIYNKLRDRIYGELDEVIKDEHLDLSSRIQTAAPRALTKLFERMENSTSESVQLKAATHVLALAGRVPVQKRIVAEMPISEMPEAQQRGIADAMAEALLGGDAVIVDAEVVEESVEESSGGDS